MPSYSYSQLKDDVFDPIVYANIGSDYTIINIFNRAIRKLLRDVDLRSTKRKTQISPGLFNDVFIYPWPTDAKRLGLIDVDPQVNRPSDFEINLTTPEEFQRRKSLEKNLAAIRENDFIKKLLLNALLTGDDSLSISTLDALTSGGGTWGLFGDGTNLSADADNYVMGSGSVRYDISAVGGTTAGIQNSGLTSFDFSDYVDNNRSVFVFAYITSPTNITNFKLRVGSGTGAYYEMTATTTHEGLSFQTGWNLLRFDFSGKTITGSPDSNAGSFVAVYMTKDPAKVSETAYRFDHIIMRGGIIHDLYYYSKYAWQSAAGVYKENTSTTTDVLVLDTDEYDLAVLAGKIEAAKERKDTLLLADYEAEYKQAIKDYQLINPSEAKLVTQITHEQ